MKLTKEFPSCFVAVALIALCAGGRLCAATSDGRQVKLSGGMPAEFVENGGQFSSPVRFATSKGRMSASFEDHAISLRLANRKELLASVRLTFVGASKEASIAGENARGTCYHYYFGNDPTKWATDVAAYGGLLYRGLYEGVDVRVREEGGRLEYDLLLAPKTDLEQVVIVCEGIKGLEIAKDGALLLETKNGRLRQTPPKTWEVLADGTKRFIECRFRKLDETRYGFEAPKRDPGLALVIDPGLEWSTFLGGRAGSRWTHWRWRETAAGMCWWRVI